MLDTVVDTCLATLMVFGTAAVCAILIGMIVVVYKMAVSK